MSVKEWKLWYEQAPVCREQKFVNIPLKHLGANHCVSEKVIALCHNQRIALTMKQFIADNVAVASKPKVTFTGPGGSSSTDFDWIEATTLAHAQEAILNYQVIIHHLFPWVVTGFIIQRVLLKVNWLANHNLSTRMNIIRTFFNGVLRINAARACKLDLPLDYKEQLEFMQTITERVPTPSGTQTGGSEDYRIPRGSAPRSGAGTRASSASSRKDTRARFNNLLLCFDYNSTKGVECTKRPTTSGCKDPKANQEFAHRCNFKLAGGGFCLREHRRKDH